MKGKFNIRKIHTVLPILGLALLLLLSPCKVRSFIQDKLDIPKTETINKSQTTLVGNESCSVYDFFSDVVIKAKKSLKFLNVFVANSTKSASILVYSLNKPAHSFEMKNAPITLPLYILYQNLMVYS